jgi:hypothetical protein
VEFAVPPLVNEELWQKANKITRERGRGRGKEGKAISALLRNRIFCPSCGKPMVVRRRTDCDKIYYLCSRLNHAHEKEHCTYQRYVPGAWDNSVWDCVYAILKQDSWIKERLSGIENENHDVDKVVKLEQQKVLQSKNKITKSREGFEGGLYNLDEAKSKVNGYLDTIKKTEQEIERLIRLAGGEHARIDVDELKEGLERLAQVNLDKATFAEKRDLINKLGIRVYPSEDLKTTKIRCSLNFGNDNDNQVSDQCVIIQFASLRSNDSTMHFVIIAYGYLEFRSNGNNMVINLITYSFGLRLELTGLILST